MSKQFVLRSVFAPYFNSFIAMKENMGFGRTKFQNVLLEFDRFFLATGATDIHITSEQITAWRETRINDKNRTLYDKYSIMRQICRYLCHLGYECYIPRLPRQNWPPFIPYIFTHVQMESIFEASDRLTLPNKNMASVLIAIPAVIRFLYSTGVRISEALSLKNEDVDFARQRIVLRKTKNQMERLVPINASLLEVLRQYSTYRGKIPIKSVSAPNAFFFVSTVGKSLSKGAVYRWFKVILKECGIPHLGNYQGPRIHDIRHTCAVHSLIKMVHDKVDIYCALPILSVFLGHKSLKGTETYVRLTREMHPDIIEMEQTITSFIFPTKIAIKYDND
jgi:integrase